MVKKCNLLFNVYIMKFQIISLLSCIKFESVSFKAIYTDKWIQTTIISINHTDFIRNKLKVWNLWSLGAFTLQIYLG